MVELLADLEKFLEEQRKKIEADRKLLNKATSTPLSFLNKNSTSLPGIHDHVHANLKKPREDAYTQTEDLTTSFLTSPKTDDSKLIISSMSKGLTENNTDFPKYGLPGLGEYEEKHKLLVQEQKKELNKYFSQVIKEKEGSKRKGPVNYNELLAQKREEEEQYRGLNDGLFPEQYNASFLPRIDVNSNVAFHKIRSPSARVTSAGKKEIEDLTGIFSRIQQYTEMDDHDHLPFLRHPDPLPSIRTSNFRSADNIRTTLFPDVGGLSPRPNTLSDIDRPRELPPNPQVGVIPQANERNMRRPFDHSQEYRYQLEQQIQEQKARKKRLLEEEKISQPLDPLGGNLFNTGLNSKWETNDYNPWGKSGAGAPMRDLHGNVVTHRRGLNAMNAYTSSLPFYENSVHTLDGHRKVPEKWHDGHWPLPEDKPLKPKFNYHDELRQQIEEKRRREQDERELQRREEEQLNRRMERQREKIQAEYEAELMKQKLREEEQRRKAERLLQIQELERKESHAKRRNNKPDAEWWEREANNKVDLRDQDSPPLPSSRQHKDFTIKESSTPSPNLLRSNIISPKNLNPHDNISRIPSPEPVEAPTPPSSPKIQSAEERIQSPPIPTLRHQNKTYDKRPPSSESSDPVSINSPPVVATQSTDQSRTSSAQKSPTPLHRSPSPTIPALRHSSAITKKPTILISSPEHSATDTTSHDTPTNIPNITYRHPMISQEEISTPVISRSSTASSVASSHRRRKGEPKPVQLPLQPDILNQLSAMRHQLQLEQQRLQQLMKRDDKYEVFDPRIDGSKSKSSASWRSRRDPNNFDGVELDEIAARNRERKQNLEKLKHADANGGLNNSDDDNVLENFLKQQS